MDDLPLQLDPNGELPIYAQIYWQIRTMILDGRLAPGARLPPSRRLAQAQGISRMTAVAAYDQLAAEGYVAARTGAGTFVTEQLPAVADDVPPFTPRLSPWGRRMVRAAPLPDWGHPPGDKPADPVPPPGRPEIDFGFGRSFPHIFPYDVWRRLLARYLSTDDTMLSRYGSAAGFYPLRQAIADYVRQWRGVRCTAEQVVIVSGAQQALDLLSRLLLNPGDPVLVETPGYRDAFALFRVHGARLIGLAVDDEGFPVRRIPSGSGARLAFVTPAHQFPRGGTMPLGRRLALLQWARTSGALIVEDDYDSELRYDGRPLAALQGLDEDGRVIYLGTFSKVLFPALRLGYVVLPPGLLPLFEQAKGLVDRGAPTLTQAAIADFIVEGHFGRHLRRLRQAYGERWQTLATALQRYLGDRVRFANQAAGLHVMLYLDPARSETAVVRQAAAVGVGVYPGAGYHLEPDPPPSILLGFSGLAPAEIEDGVRRLATVLGV